MIKNQRGKQRRLARFVVADRKLQQQQRPTEWQDEPEEQKSKRKREAKEESKIKPAEDWDSKFQFLAQNSQLDI